MSIDDMFSVVYVGTDMVQIRIVGGFFFTSLRYPLLGYLKNNFVLSLAFLGFKNITWFSLPSGVFLTLMEKRSPLLIIQRLQ